jgi:threonine/homoserine/homoserine lactone efflux protein
MPDAQHLLLFVLAGLLLNLTPGPDVLYIVSHAIRQGARAGVVAALGVSAGCFVHIAAAAVGVSALLATSAAAFAVLKWAGAAYLLYVGMKLLAGKSAPKRWGFAGAPPPAYGLGSAPPPAYEEAPSHLWSVFRGGFLTNALNPKVAIFFLAFVPQFIAPQAQHKALAFLALGIVFNLNTVVMNSGWALAAAWIARTDAAQRSLHWLDRVAGLMFMGFGLKLALAENPTH